MSGQNTHDRSPAVSLVKEASRHFGAGNLERAKQVIIEALKLDMTDPECLYLGGRIALEGQEFGMAVRLFSEAARCREHDANIFSHLGVALAADGKLDSAINAYNKSLEIDPENRDALWHMGHVLCRMNRFADAIEFYERLLALEPDHIGAAANLADLLEKRSRLEEADSIVNNFLKLKPDDTGLLMVQARLEKRRGNNNDAIALLLDMLQKNPPPSIAAEAYYVLGLLYDDLEQPVEAFRCFQNGNRLTADRLDPAQIDKNEYVREVEKMEGLLEEYLSEPLIPQAGYVEQPPVFLVGFPRSGTTLLGQILDSHPDLATLEERPTVAAMDSAYSALSDGGSRTLKSLSEADITDLRGVYFNAVSSCPEAHEGKHVIDKMPLNIAKIPLIHRVFPDAKYILAVRHPCDACLSCFMQYFSVNNAMANFFTLQDSVALYAKVMGMWMRGVSALGLQNHMIRYEDLVADFRGETARLLGFLGVEWSDAVLAYHKHAGNSETVDTPSYHQVTRPIYRKASYRWKRYENQMAPFMNFLEPYIRYFGYAEDR